ncbi:hypothetical protein Pcac1_g18191 [Phytophthora cactorum]|uniref:Uncharacterized protein n=2 Tax=Phytophthora cactorum TaxID=29920 RepID=A0A8T1GFA4_9STRA|nr:hypothetical protein Pcac1_g18191 [Phytophthora cactorum]KAG2824924.1 hypothetical protein PC111_g9615 [Phytophthora cactorum]KAG2842337.1 hypothetical protein PC112_g3053 [Phytophthora cactorum]KAG2861335.1 hypothetical protein PC113_g7257 [Phytophthora cactorum]KAG2947171.1 hypothetical protein PC117_g7020 [Phytophthora cactorum]
MSEYESFSSGQSEDGVEIDNDDDNGYDRDQTEEDYDDLSEDDAVSMDEAFVESLQVGNGALNKRTTQQREDALHAMEWTPVPSGYAEGVHTYPGLNTKPGAPVHD